MTIDIVPLAENHFETLRQVLDRIAREKLFLAFLHAPPPELAYSFYRGILARDDSHFVALSGGEVVGWCDVLPTHGEARAHVGVLGIGLLPAARHQGVGRRLMGAAIAKARAKGLTRIELTVRTDNLNAKALYERMGFVHEGLHRQGFRIDGEFHDVHAMALLGTGEAT